MATIVIQHDTETWEVIESVNHALKSRNLVFERLKDESIFENDENDESEVEEITYELRTLIDER